MQFLVLSISPVGSGDHQLEFWHGADGKGIARIGCWKGTLNELSVELKRRYKEVWLEEDRKALKKEYRGIVKVLEARERSWS